NSGVMVRNEMIDAALAADGDTFTVPFWQDLGDDEANISSDDPLTKSVAKKITAGKQTVRKSFINQSWSSMNLASELAGANAKQAIANRVTEYWARQGTRRLIATMKGVFAAHSDMMVDISGGTGIAAVITRKAVLDATASMGDAMAKFTAIAMHSDVYRKLLADEQIQYVQPAGVSFDMPTYCGLQVVFDDSCPAAAGVYTSFLLGAGAIGFGMADPKAAKGVEVKSDPDAGNGGGAETLYSRVNMAIHPLGFQWKEAEVVGDSPTIAELAKATNWLRVLGRKAVPLAALKHKIV
ncbi:MAG: major capsid protein, partial [Aeromonas popoffii]|uniref:major capsid protein n=1 Tax=Aeromonas popoffii TaxID=70856 RepID=UPI003F409835